MARAKVVKAAPRAAAPAAAPRARRPGILGS